MPPLSRHSTAIPPFAPNDLDWMERPVPDGVRNLLRQAAEATGRRRVEDLISKAQHELYLVGRCRACLSPLGRSHYCSKQGEVLLDHVVKP